MPRLKINNWQHRIDVIAYTSQRLLKLKIYKNACWEPEWELCLRSDIYFWPVDYDVSFRALMQRNRRHLRFLQRAKQLILKNIKNKLARLVFAALI